MTAPFHLLWQQIIRCRETATLRRLQIKTLVQMGGGVGLQNEKGCDAPDDRFGKLLLIRCANNFYLSSKFDCPIRVSPMLSGRYSVLYCGSHACLNLLKKDRSIGSLPVTSSVVNSTYWESKHRSTFFFGPPAHLWNKWNIVDCDININRYFC